jgi:serine phosphatase RsbU (regulator of sigma subunit)
MELLEEPSLLDSKQTNRLKSSGTLTQTDSLQKRIEELETQTQYLHESMRYAGSIQRSILPNERVFQNVFTDAFVIFEPKDIVSGDFYWIFQHNDDVYFAVGDCTGHGIPGALVNIAGNTLLRQIIRLEGFSDPAKIIAKLDEELTLLFNENLTQGIQRDGMDIVFCKFNLTKKTGSFCGAGRPLVLVRDGELIEHKKGPDAIGHCSKDEKIFETVDFELQSGDQFYLFSDGYTDQFGGENVKKFNRKRLRSLLTSLTDKSSAQQKEELLFHFNQWKGKQEQVDDVCLLGIKI